MALLVGLACIAGAILTGTVLLFGTSAQASGVARSLAQIEGLRAEQAMAKQDLPLLDRLIGPAGGFFVALARRFTAGGYAERLQHRLDIAGNPAAWTPDKVLAAKGLSLVTGLVLGLLLGARSGLLLLLLWTAVLGVALYFLPDLLLYNAGLKRQQALQRSLPDALDMLTVSVEAGLGFDAALAQVARNAEGPIAGEFFRVLQEMQIGKSRSEAFQGLSERTTVDELKVFTSALVQADRLGIPIANVLREQSREMRVKRRQRAEEKAQKVPIKILFPLVLCILPVMFIVIIGPGVIQIIKAFTGTL
ncbi:MAG: type II secretion system F family protein [Motilibacteraceae bacterium]